MPAQMSLMSLTSVHWKCLENAQMGQPFWGVAAGARAAPASVSTDSRRVMWRLYPLPEPCPCFGLHVCVELMRRVVECCAKLVRDSRFLVACRQLVEAHLDCVLREQV